MRTKFDLVISFIGSASCNPVLRAQLGAYWDDRFFFSAWNDALINRLLEQQEQLKTQGVTRSVCILCDDVILTGNAEEQLAHMAMRGRHFNISLMMCAVSYTCVPKRTRRSLDCLLVYSLPMSGDMQVLAYEFCSRTSMARFALNHLQEHECLVLETLSKSQKLYKWRADLVEVGSDGTLQTEGETGPERSETPEEVATPEESPVARRPEGTDEPPDRTESGAPDSTSTEPQS